MELTLGNKAKFFALYWGQLILLHEGTNTISHVCQSLMTNKSIGIHSLLLKPLSSITDEDTLAVCKICNFKNQTLDTCKMFIENYFENQYAIHREYSLTHNISFSIDYLRSKGYAFPWMNMSVDDLISAGWIKLKS